MLLQAVAKEREAQTLKDAQHQEALQKAQEEHSSEVAALHSFYSMKGSSRSGRSGNADMLLKAGIALGLCAVVAAFVVSQCGECMRGEGNAAPGHHSAVH